MFPSLSTPHLALFFASLLLGGCSERDVAAESGRRGPLSSEKSPTADFLPAPLASSANRGAQEKSLRGAAGTRGGTRSLFSAEQMLLPEPELKSSGPAFTFAIDFELPPHLGVNTKSAHGSPAVGAAAGSPLRLEGAVLVETDTNSARLTVRFVGPLWPVPPGTELRSRSDKLGWLLVWPDGRSYRVVPEGAVGVLFDEGRVDVMPRVEGTLSEVNGGDAGKKDSRIRRLQSERGNLELSLSTNAETFDAGHLLCDLFTELLRARREPELCGLGEFPTRAVYSFPPEGEVVVKIETPHRRAEAELTEFELPPHLPIWKPGELPPGMTLVARLDPANAEGAKGLDVKNASGLPLFFFVDGAFGFRLGSETTAMYGNPRPGKTFLARDLFGTFSQRGTLDEAPALRLGAPEDPEASDQLKSRSGSAP